MMVLFSEMSGFLIITVKMFWAHHGYLHKGMKFTCDFVARNDKQRKQNRSLFYIRR